MKEKKAIRLLLLSLLTAIALPAGAHSYLADKPVASAPELTFATWNIMASRLNKTPLLAAAVPALQSDIIALQEVDFNTQRSAKNAGTEEPVNQAAMLARAGNMQYAECRSIDFEGGQYGTALLSRWKIDKTEQVKLSNIDGREQRTACVNYITVPGMPAPLAVIITHPDQERDNTLRLKQVRELMALVDKVGKNAIPLLIGDLNLVPASPEYRELRYQMNDTLPTEGDLTYPSWNPNRRIDYVLTSTAQQWDAIQTKNPSVTEFRENIHWGQLSDHLPLVVRLKLRHL
ncbi:endonuclease/exonuclease/phosphatase family protein [Salmonella enterica]|nr:endonuclease/exonuclease/phosphatase family protein [Salmonella enterica]EJX2429747.1 endonuclease/exonuclease/phosphatase family protein [Salmonella enterica]EJX3549625.1 endonuclease/exonuclease/phosphatase family protein [Salmonella enterica]